MRSARVWKRLLGVEHIVVEEVVFDEEADAVVAMVLTDRTAPPAALCGLSAPLLGL